MSLALQRDLQAKRHHELNRNIGLLNLWHPMSNELQLLIKQDMFERPNQTAFIHLSYYLINIIDHRKAASLSSILYDKKSENLYRGQLVAFISSINDEGLITPVMSSHLVNAGGYKVTKLMFQLSILALKRAIQQHFKPNESKLNSLNLCKSIKIGDKNKDDIKLEIDAVLERVKTKTLDWYQYQNKVKEVSDLYKLSIEKLKIESISKENLLDNIIQSFLQCTNCKGLTGDIEKLRDVCKSSQFIASWNADLNNRFQYLEKTWIQNTKPLLKKASLGRSLSESLVNRHTIKDRSCYTLEFIPEKDCLDFMPLEKHVSSQQRYVLKNIVKDGVLQMPNLLRAYAVVMCFAFRNVLTMYSIVQFDDILSTNRENYKQIKTEMKNLLNEVFTFDQQVRISASTSTLSISSNSDLQELNKMDSFPKLPVIKFTERSRHRFTDPSKLTPVHINRLQFNSKRHDTRDFSRSHTVFDVARRGALQQSTFLRQIENVRLDLAELKMGPPSLKDDLVQRTMQHDISKSNQSLIDRSNIFSKQQIARLFTTSSRKHSARKSASKLYEQSMIDNHRDRKWNKLFNETLETDAALYKSHSSPNLNEIHSMRKHKMSVQRSFKHRNLCEVLAENSPESPKNVSGVDMFNEKENASNTPLKRGKEYNSNFSPRSKGYANGENNMYSLQNFHSESVLSNKVSNINALQPCDSPEKGKTSIDKSNDLRTPSCDSGLTNSNKRKLQKIESWDRILELYRKHPNTPVCHVQRKIDMFKTDDFSSPTLPQVEEKENKLNELNVDVSPKHSVLPDLLSPSYPISIQKSKNIEGTNLNFFNSPELSSGVVRKRESLGTALGVDSSFLDQFDLID